ncbi:MAG TPA: 1-acyl-sn-glycerol-3-phosphate acyltransferase [Candidatus Gallacutalibacter stercoravium]|nr:1-acyl-sn-glycerol-3-phosphate acyltransferase [Candidatus Gallacutalibacter stercoravium]
MYRFLVALLCPIARLLFRIRIEGVENIPRKGGVLLCSNHKSVLDPYLLMMKCPRRVRFMAKDELFTQHGALAGWFLRKMGAFSVHRGEADLHALKTAVGLLQQGELVGIFPQGGCVRDKDISFTPKAGAALVADKAGVAVLPACIYSQGPIRLFSKIVVRYGAPVSAKRFQAAGGYRAGARLLAGEITHLLQQEYRE